jgi:hypothetical protein
MSTKGDALPGRRGTLQSEEVTKVKDRFPTTSGRKYRRREASDKPMYVPKALPL